MHDKNKPILTIGIIFKNEIRCLKRCLDSLQPLRCALDCELIMADTGSSDGSREIAAAYADILFDFPWINDFSAARNAIMDKSSGNWYLTVDADEYLDSNISELVTFLKSSGNQSNVCGIIVRNYDSFEMDGRYTDFIAVRMVRMATGLRYRGAIHEALPYEDTGSCEVQGLFDTLLHHDGYVGIGDARGKAKRDRNLTLLREQLKKNPEDIKLLLQYIESGRQEKDYLNSLKYAASVVEEKKEGWQSFGPAIFRHAVQAAFEKDLPEFQEWLSRSRSWFPQSFFTRIDTGYLSFAYHLKQAEDEKAIQQGEQYLNALNCFKKDKSLQTELSFSVLSYSSPYWEQGLKIYLADLYIKAGNTARAQELLEEIDASLLDDGQTETMLLATGDLHRLSTQDTSSLLVNFFHGIEKPVPSKATAAKRMDRFYRTAARAFLSQIRKDEQLAFNFHRPSYTLFLPLSDDCELGTAALMMNAIDTKEIHDLLLKIKDWSKLPIEALSHALQCSVIFPLPEMPLCSEEMDILAIRLSNDRETLKAFIQQTENTPLSEEWQQLIWTRKLILSAMKNYEWNGKGEEARLIKLFVQLENQFLPRFYAPELLCAENLSVLPAFDRLGWYFVRAFEALKKGNSSEYVSELKAALKSCPESNHIVEFLIKNTPQLRPSAERISPELEALAAQVKKILALYPADDPTVIALKASPAYQKVAKWIED